MTPRSSGRILDRLAAQPLVNTGAMIGTNCLDYRVEGDMATWKAQSEELERIAPRFATIAEAGDLGCQAWGHTGTQPSKALHAKGAAPILVIGTTGDPATPHEWAVALADQLDSGQLLTWEGNGHAAYAQLRARPLRHQGGRHLPAHRHHAQEGADVSRHAVSPQGTATLLPALH